MHRSVEKLKNLLLTTQAEVIYHQEGKENFRPIRSSQPQTNVLSDQPQTGQTSNQTSLKSALKTRRVVADRGVSGLGATHDRGNNYYNNNNNNNNNHNNNNSNSNSNSISNSNSGGSPKLDLPGLDIPLPSVEDLQRVVKRRNSKDLRSVALAVLDQTAKQARRTN